MHCEVFLAFAQSLIRVGESTSLTADHSATSEWGIVLNEAGLIYGEPISQTPGRTTWQVTGINPGIYPVTIAAKCHGGKEISYTATIQVDPILVPTSTVEPGSDDGIASSNTDVGDRNNPISNLIYEATPVVAVILTGPNAIATLAPVSITETATAGSIATPSVTQTAGPESSPSDPEDPPVVLVNPENQNPDLGVGSNTEIGDGINTDDGSSGVSVNPEGNDSHLGGGSSTDIGDGSNTDTDDGSSGVLVNPEGNDPNLGAGSSTDIGDGQLIDQGASSVWSGSSWLMIIFRIWLWSLLALIVAVLIYLIWRRRQSLILVFAPMTRRRTQDDELEDEVIRDDGLGDSVLREDASSEDALRHDVSMNGGLGDDLLRHDLLGGDVMDAEVILVEETITDEEYDKIYDRLVIDRVSWALGTATRYLRWGRQRW